MPADAKYLLQIVLTIGYFAVFIEEMNANKFMLNAEKAEFEFETCGVWVSVQYKF